MKCFFNKKILFFLLYLIITGSFAVGKQDLSMLAMMFHSDKGPQAYNYTKVYNYYFAALQDKPINFLEIGAYLPAYYARPMWDAYFTHPSTKLYFIDATRNNSVHAQPLSSRCSVYIPNSTEFKNFLIRIPPLDIIVDDGTHLVEEQITFFKGLFARLKPGGIYIIEDLHTSYKVVRNNDNSALNNQKIDNSTISFLENLISTINYSAACSPLNWGPGSQKVPYDYLEQWPLVINRAMAALQDSIESLHFYPNMCVIIKKEQKKQDVTKSIYNPKPISFCLSAAKMVTEIPDKDRDFAYIVPGDLKTYIYSDEASYYKDYQRSLYAVTRSKVGVDCLRHYEILMNGCIPYFIDLDDSHPNTMYFLPKELIKEAMNLPGVSYLKIDHSLFDREKYTVLLKKILEHTRTYLTTQNMARYLLKSLNYSGKGSILYLYHPRFEIDYLRDLILTGLKEELGDKVIDYPKDAVIYKTYAKDTKKLYGKGFSYTKILDDIPVNRDNIEQRIKRKEFELIIYGNLHEQFPLYDLVCKHYEPEKIAYLCGCEAYTGATHRHYCSYIGVLPNLFIREWSVDSW